MAFLLSTSSHGIDAVVLGEVVLLGAVVPFDGFCWPCPKSVDEGDGGAATLFRFLRTVWEVPHSRNAPLPLRSPHRTDGAPNPEHCTHLCTSVLQSEHAVRWQLSA